MNIAGFSKGFPNFSGKLQRFLRMFKCVIYFGFKGFLGWFSEVPGGFCRVSKRDSEWAKYSERLSEKIQGSFIECQEHYRVVSDKF